MASLTWLGHASYRLDTSDGKRIYVDPWLSGPTTPESGEGSRARRRDRASRTATAITRRTSPKLQQKLGCTVLGMVELMAWYSNNGVDDRTSIAFNKGGTVEVAGVRFTMTNAFHSSAAPDLSYAGEAAGFVVFADDARIYFAGDTTVFGDMALIARLYEPTVAVLPIGDHYTMGPEEAALALELLGNPRCVPGHWGTFPLLAGTPDELASLTSATVERRRPRRHGRPVRERWFGATGRRVPEITLEGELELGDALVLDTLDDEALRAAHARGPPGRRPGRERRRGEGSVGTP